MNIHGILLFICIRCSKCFDLIINEYDYLIVFLWYAIKYATASSERLLMGGRGARETRGVRGNRDEGDGENNQESMIGGEANAPGRNVRGIGGAPPAVFGGA